MLISSRGQYAIRILLDLAIHDSGEAINVKTVDGPLIPATQQEDIQERPVELVVNELWGNLQEQIENTLDSVTLLDLMNSYNDKICFSYTI